MATGIDRYEVIIERGIDLIHEILKQATISEELRIELSKWRSDAEGVLPRD